MKTKRTKTTPRSKSNQRNRPLSEPKTFPIQIDTGSYTGSFKLDGVEIRDTTKPFSLSVGVHTFDPDSVGRGSFQFNVCPSGNVTVENIMAASGSEKVLKLNTVEVTVDAGLLVSWGGSYRIPVYWDRTPEALEKFTFVPGLAYQLQLSGATASLIFDVRKDGMVWCRSHAANGSVGRLKLNVAWVEVTPQKAVSYQVNASPFRTTPLRLPVLMGLPVNLTCGGEIKQFTPEYGQMGALRVNGYGFTWEVPWDQQPPARRR
jgi:hypothetical protein